jgi:tRNA modification GTPase
MFNALLDRSRAIVSHIPGTTRDYLEESLIIDGYTIHLYDTAGLRNTEDTIELQGILVTSSLVEQSDLILVVNDAEKGFDNSDDLRSDLSERFPDTPVVIVQNKMDLVQTIVPPIRETDIPCSTVTGDGLSSIRETLLEQVRSSSAGLSDALINARQASLLKEVVGHLESASNALEQNETADLISIDVRAAVRLIGEITGETWNPDILDSVFAKFCIGK